MYTVKGVKSFRGREGHGFECSLYKDGKKIGTVTDHANGGEVDFYLNDGEKEHLDAHCASLPLEPCVHEFMKKDYPDGYPVSCDALLCRLVDEFETHKRNKRVCKTKTMVKVVEKGKDTFYTYPAKFSIALRDAIKDRDYPNTDVIFMNEVYS